MLESELISTYLAFDRPVIVLGPHGSGTFQAAHGAVFPKFSWAEIDFKEERYNPTIDYGTGFLTFDAHQKRMQDFLELYPDKVLFGTNLQHMDPTWVVFILVQMYKGRKILLEGRSCPFMPLLDRFEIVRM